MTCLWQTTIEQGLFAEIAGETDLSAEQTRAQAAARIPQAELFRWRPACACCAAQTRAQAPVRLIPLAAALPHLKRRSDFLRVARDGRSWSTPGLVMQVLRRDDRADPNGSVTPLRLGLTVSRKVGNAVQRNRARRRLRAAAEIVLPEAAAGGRDYVLIGRRMTLTRPFPALLQDLHTALQKLKALRTRDSWPAVHAAARAPVPADRSAPTTPTRLP